MAVVLDSSVLIAFLYEDDDLNRRSRTALQAPEVAEAEWVVPATVCAEVLVGAYRSGPIASELIERFFQEGVDRIEPVSSRIASAAARIRAEFNRVSLADAFVLATGEVVDAQTIITADRAWSLVSDRVRVV